MECLANGAAVAQRLGNIAFSLVAPVLPRDAPLLHSKSNCGAGNASARQQNRLLHSNRRC